MRRRSALRLVTRATVPVVFALLVNGALSSAYAASCTAEQGQLLIDQGRYKQAISEFTCVIDAHPTDVAPTSITALTGASFACWAYFDYLGAIHLLDQLLDLEPANPYGNLFRGSSRLLKNHAVNDGVGDLDYAIALAPVSPDVHYIAADAYTYGLPDPNRAFTEATFALDGGLDTPRVHAILGSAYLAFGNVSAAAAEIQTHIRLVTTGLVTTSALAAGTTLQRGVVPGQTLDIPLVVSAGDKVSIVTSSHDYWDTILVLLDSNGNPVLGSDDSWKYFAAFDWTAPSGGTYRIRVTFFEGVITGTLRVSRK